MPDPEKTQGLHDESIKSKGSPQDDHDQLEKLEELKQQAVDTVHGDEANKILVNYTGDVTWSAEEEKKLVRKIDIRLLTILCLTYGLQYYDKAMLSQAVSPRSERWSLGGRLLMTPRHFLACGQILT